MYIIQYSQSSKLKTLSRLLSCFSILDSTPRCRAARARLVSHRMDGDFSMYRTQYLSNFTGSRPLFPIAILVPAQGRHCIEFGPLEVSRCSLVDGRSNANTAMHREATFAVMDFRARVQSRASAPSVMIARVLGSRR